MILHAEAILIGAGAGMSVDSGIPAYRLYDKKRAGSSTTLAPLRPILFGLHPEEAWGAAGARLDLFRASLPHHGYELLLSWSRDAAAGAFVLTSNVDGQFAKTGFSPDQIIEGHGSMHHLQCHEPCHDDVWSAADLTVELDAETGNARPPLPACPRCGGPARPNVFMFGDHRFLPTRTKEQQRRFDRWQEAIRGRRLVVIECGAGTAVPTIRHMCEKLAQERGAPLIRINSSEPQGPEGTISLAMGAREALEAVGASFPPS